ncbi:MAG: hypothetical protein AAF195_02195 [Pseudomonadota bacterium]
MPITKQSQPIKTVKQHLEDAGYKAEELIPMAAILHHAGGLDGIIKPFPQLNLEQKTIFKNPGYKQAGNILYDHLQNKQYENILSKEYSFDDFLEELQENFFRKYRGDNERSQITNTAEDLEPLKTGLVDLFKKAGLVTEVLPTKTQYDAALVFGATYVSMEDRLQYLLKMQKEGRINSIPPIYVLAGARDLWFNHKSDKYVPEMIAQKINIAQSANPEITPEQIKEKGMEIFNNARENDKKNEGEARKAVAKYFQNTYKITWPTEADAAKYLMQKYQNDNPKLITEYHIVNAPKKSNGNRPDTFDTIKQFITDIKLKPEFMARQGKEINILACSEQPYVNSQNATLKYLQKSLKNSHTETIGPASQKFAQDNIDEIKNASVKIILSEIAGQFYKTKQVAQALAKQKSNMGLA